MTKKQISTADAPAAIGPYSQGVIAKGQKLIFVSGQIPLKPDTGEMVGSTIVEQTHQALTNLQAVLAAAGVGMDAVVKTTVLLQNMADFAAMNEVYQQYFSAVFPARAAFAAAALPKGALVEIEAVAVSE